MDNKKDEKILELVNILKNTKYLVFSDTEIILSTFSKYLLWLFLFVEDIT